MTTANKPYGYDTTWSDSQRRQYDQASDEQKRHILRQREGQGTPSDQEREWRSRHNPDGSERKTFLTPEESAIRAKIGRNVNQSVYDAVAQFRAEYGDAAAEGFIQDLRGHADPGSALRASVAREFENQARAQGATDEMLRKMRERLHRAGAAGGSGAAYLMAWRNEMERAIPEFERELNAHNIQRAIDTERNALVNDEERRWFDEHMTRFQGNLQETMNQIAVMRQERDQRAAEEAATANYLAQFGEADAIEFGRIIAERGLNDGNAEIQRILNDRRSFSQTSVDSFMMSQLAQQVAGMPAQVQGPAREAMYAAENPEAAQMAVKSVVDNYNAGLADNQGIEANFAWAGESPPLVSDFSNEKSKSPTAQIEVAPDEALFGPAIDSSQSQQSSLDPQALNDLQGLLDSLPDNATRQAFSRLAIEKGMAEAIRAYFPAEYQAAENAELGLFDNPAVQSHVFYPEIGELGPVDTLNPKLTPEQAREYALLLRSEAENEPRDTQRLTLTPAQAREYALLAGSEAENEPRDTQRTRDEPTHELLTAAKEFVADPDSWKDNALGQQIYEQEKESYKQMVGGGPLGSGDSDSLDAAASSYAEKMMPELWSAAWGLVLQSDELTEAAVSERVGDVESLLTAWREAGGDGEALGAVVGDDRLGREYPYSVDDATARLIIADHLRDLHGAAVREITFDGLSGGKVVDYVAGLPLAVSMGALSFMPGDYAAAQRLGGALDIISPGDIPNTQSFGSYFLRNIDPRQYTLGDLLDETLLGPLDAIRDAESPYTSAFSTALNYGDALPFLPMPGGRIAVPRINASEVLARVREAGGDAVSAVDSYLPLSYATSSFGGPQLTELTNAQLRALNLGAGDVSWLRTIARHPAVASGLITAAAVPSLFAAMQSPTSQIVEAPTIEVVASHQLPATVTPAFGHGLQTGQTQGVSGVSDAAFAGLDMLQLEQGASERQTALGSDAQYNILEISPAHIPTTTTATTLSPRIEEISSELSLPLALASMDDLSRYLLTQHDSTVSTDATQQSQSASKAALGIQMRARPQVQVQTPQAVQPQTQVQTPQAVQPQTQVQTPQAVQPQAQSQPIGFNPVQAVELAAFEVARPEIAFIEVQPLSVPEVQAASIAAPWIDVELAALDAELALASQSAFDAGHQIPPAETMQAQTQVRTQARPQIRPQKRGRLFQRRRRGTRSRRRRPEIDRVNADIDRERRRGRFPAIAQWVDAGSVKRMNLHTRRVYDAGTSETTASPSESFRIVEYAPQRPPRRYIDLPGQDDIIIDAGGATGITGRNGSGVQRTRPRKVVR